MNTLPNIRMIIKEAIQEVMLSTFDEEYEEEVERMTSEDSEYFFNPNTDDARSMYEARKANLLSRVKEATRHLVVKPAPSKLMLRRFGGPLTVEEFRATTNDPHSQTTIISNLHRCKFIPDGFGFFEADFKKICYGADLVKNTSNRHITKEPFDSSREALEICNKNERKAVIPAPGTDTQARLHHGHKKRPQGASRYKYSKKPTYTIPPVPAFRV